MLQCDRWPPPYTTRCPNPAVYRLTRTHPTEGPQYLGGPVCPDCAVVVLAKEENELVGLGGPWDVEEIDTGSLSGKEGEEDIGSAVAPVVVQAAQATQYRRRRPPNTGSRRSRRSPRGPSGLRGRGPDIDVDSLNEG
jgi:hypothetical protein